LIQSPHILNGIPIAKKHLEIAARNILRIQKEGGTVTLATVQVGEAKDALLYFVSLEKLLQKLGIRHIARVFPEEITEANVFKEILELNSDSATTGIMVFAPLPVHLDSTALLSAVDILKDAEGRRVIHGIGDRVVSPTANAVLTLLEETGCEIAGKEAVVVGHSDLVGKPTSILLLDKLATVTVCHTKTKNLRAHVEEADIVVAAAGKPHLIKGEWIKPGAVVIDVGENELNGKLVGDVDFETAKMRASFISPVPGGVGPVTNVMLIKNLISLYELQKRANGNH